MRLELTRRGDYAVRAMLSLADAHGSVVTGARIASETGIPRSFLPQVMGTLVHAGLVDGLPGRSGGYRLAKPARDVSLLAIVEAAEGDSRRTTCILRGGPCQQDGACRVHDAFFAGQEALLAAIASATLADLDGVAASPAVPHRGRRR
jgi:Rrf2 family iron-sulfur cluster assembly transcriptional regulator